MSDSLYCQHGRLADACSDCDYLAALDRGDVTAKMWAGATGNRETAPVNDHREVDNPAVVEATSRAEKATRKPTMRKPAE
jgi:hypothetical protein